MKIATSKTLHRQCYVILLLLISFFVTGCGSDSSDPARLPVIYKIDASAVETRYPSVAIPSGVSANGQVVYGTIYTLAEVGFLPVTGFRWTREGGTILIDDVTGYAGYVTLATHASNDGKTIVGNVYQVSQDRFIPWVWQEGAGYTILPVPQGVTTAKIHSVTPDGKLVFGTYIQDIEEGFVKIFVWSKEKGFSAFDPGTRKINGVCMANNGKRIVVNSYNNEQPETMGPFALDVSDSNDWFGLTTMDSRVIVTPPAVDMIDQSFFATDFSTNFFWQSACSRDGSVIGGSFLREFSDTNIMHPAFWVEKERRLVTLSGLAWPGNVSAVSPDGQWVGFASHFGLGNDEAYLWNGSIGVKNLYQLLGAADNYYKTNLLGPFGNYTSIPTFITGFSENNSTLVGTSYAYSAGVPMFGFVIDNFDTVTKVP